MTAQKLSQPSQASYAVLEKKAVEAEKLFAKSHPELYAELTRNSNNKTTNTPLPAKSALAVEQFISQLTAEEHQAILEKAQLLAQLPAGNSNVELEDYLEQQLSEILGFTITAELEGNHLPFTHGCVEALPHLKRSPTDAVSDHSLSRAGFSGKRSFFGWPSSSPVSQEHGQSSENEKYGISLPLFALPDWQVKAAYLKSWYQQRKVVLVNPLHRRAVVCAVTDVYHMVSAKYQFGASPEVILESQVWSPENNGKILLYFVENNAVPLGLRTLHFALEKI